MAADKSMQGHSYEEVEEIKNFLFKETVHRPTIGVLCGSGLGHLVHSLEEDKFSIRYEDIPNFPTGTVLSHGDKMVFGMIGGRAIVCLQGRFHLYEGHSMHKCTLPVRVFAALGVESIIVTNTAGGVNKSYNVGDIMVIKDHISFPLMAGNNPLIGLNDERFGPRFPSMSHAYNKAYSTLALDICKRFEFDSFTRHGVYCMLSGPNYATPAEHRLVELVGGDAVGMSTVPEVVIANHMGLRVLGISLVTNTDQAPDHSEELEVAAERSSNLVKIVTTFITEMPLGEPKDK